MVVKDLVNHPEESRPAFLAKESHKEVKWHNQMWALSDLSGIGLEGNMSEEKKKCWQEPSKAFPVSQVRGATPIQAVTRN